MAEIIELPREERSRSNERVDERLGGGYLADGALSSYLGNAETVAFVLHAKRGGVTVERDGGTETYKPSRGYRTVVAITDLRVVIAIGGADGGGDRVVPIPLSTVTRVETDSGLLRERLVVRTEVGERWSIPAGSDLDPVVAYLETARETWSRANRFAVRVEDHLTTARDRLDAGDPDGARDAADAALSAIASGREEVRALDLGDRVLDHAEFDAYRADVRAIQRRALADTADEHVERGERAERDGRLRAAHDALEAARDAAERALSIDADEPPDERLRERIETVERDRDRLETRPRERAKTALEDARSIDDPERRARRLTDALAAHRDWLGHCWGPSSPFAGDPDEIRAAILEIVDETVDVRTAVIDRLLAAAERLRAGGRTGQALSACDQADEQLEATQDVVSELAPDRDDALRAVRVEIDHERALIEREAGRAEDVSGPDDRAASDEPPSAGPDSSASATETVAGVTTKAADPARSERDHGHDGDAVREQSSDEFEFPGAERDRVTIEAEIRAMDEAAFTRFVAACWNELGWETTIFAQSRGQYDVMAIRRQLVDLRVVIWTVHDPGGDLDPSVVDRCVTDRDNVQRADAAAIVTTATVPDPVRERADRHDIKLLDFADLLDLVDTEGLADLALDKNN
ncbi:Uncharacterized protein HSBGL_0020 [Halapricum desulfuricans]|uniref:Restriction endonuclease type IV Mrr domain-containing protein n=1 Tax=Halapricum desulfuricans TaxID=2841257 RepID=A0A897NJL9_9EURY|nr:restriction endonuclease [Halapricum desulfuricans]QSG10466.1 Uncharacterized protein HSBGL_0020 [Halapricum desulfuricans]